MDLNGGMPPIVSARPSAGAVYDALRAAQTPGAALRRRRKKRCIEPPQRKGPMEIGSYGIFDG
jgi:hypothetical protein